MGGNNGSFIGYGVQLPDEWVVKWKEIAGEKIGEEVSDYSGEMETYVGQYGDIVLFSKSAFTSSVISRSGIYTHPEILLIDPVSNTSFMIPAKPEWIEELKNSVLSLSKRLGLSMFNIEPAYYQGFLAGF